MVRAAVSGSVLAVAVALVLAPAGGAIKLPKRFTIYQYKLQSVGSGTYTHQDGVTTIHASFKWNVKIGMLDLLPKSMSTPPQGPGGLREAGTGIGKKTSNGITGSWDVSVTGNPACSGSGGFQADGPPEATAYLNPLVRGGYVIDVLPSDNPGQPIDEKPAGAQDCSDINGPLTSNFWHDWPANEGAGDDQPALEEFVNIRPAKEGKVIEEVKVDAHQKPRSDCQCTFEWSGKVTLTRVKVIKG